MALEFTKHFASNAGFVPFDGTIDCKTMMISGRSRIHTRLSVCFLLTLCHVGSLELLPVA